MNITKKDFKEDLLYGIGLSILFIFLLILSPIMFHPVAFTGSMEPTINGGDILIVDETVVEDDIEVDDIILFESQSMNEGNVIAHRVTSINNGKMWTKGDNNRAHDQAKFYDEPQIIDEILEGRVVYIIETSSLIPF